MVYRWKLKLNRQRERFSTCEKDKMCALQRPSAVLTAAYCGNASKLTGTQMSEFTPRDLYSRIACSCCYSTLPCLFIQLDTNKRPFGIHHRWYLYNPRYTHTSVPLLLTVIATLRHCATIELCPRTCRLHSCTNCGTETPLDSPVKPIPLFNKQQPVPIHAIKIYIHACAHTHASLNI